MRQLAERVIERCLTLAACSEISGKTTRTFLSEPMHACHHAVKIWMEEAGLTVSVDAIGNIRGLRAATQSEAPRLILGSHLDTVPDAGAYDGVLGVMIGIALCEALVSQNLQSKIEVIGFSEEEGVRFGIPFLGSRALAGSLSSEILARTDPNGISVAGAIRDFGLNPDDLHQAKLDSRAAAFLEFHIEQGPVLDSENTSVAPVEAVAGQSRLEFTFTGAANHAGTTPMLRRRDALAGCVEWLAQLEKLALDVRGLVATVGRMQVSPGASNVIPGEVRATLDVRHPRDSVRFTAVHSLIQMSKNVAEIRGLSVTYEEHLDQPAVHMDRELLDLLSQSLPPDIRALPPIVSGAGHDAMIMAAKLPSVMLFLRSPNGISHHPDESVRVEDVEVAIETGQRFVHNFEKRYNRKT